MNILVVDDDKEILNLLEISLRNEGYKIFKAKDGKEALDIFYNEEIKLIVLDVMMPCIDGIQVCKEIREKSRIPILMLSAKREDMDRIYGIMTGADDYMVKPFNPLELCVRVRALLRRSYYFNEEEKDDNNLFITIGPLKINKSTHNVTINNNDISLTSTEFDILYLLSKNPGRIFSAEEIFQHVWNEKYFQSNNTVMTHVSRLRTKLELAANGEKIIHTVWGVGYKVEKI
ncbi:response regulator transcription factor [Clostridium sp.]|uniref:response regulator transcription factor n=1 Tax=Clostridium sp. TaxID=1506 RepID=UPI003F3B6FE1